MTMTHVHAQRDMPNDIQNQNTSGALSVYTGLHLFLRSPFFNIFFLLSVQMTLRFFHFSFLSGWSIGYIVILDIPLFDVFPAFFGRWWLLFQIDQCGIEV